MVCFFFFQVIGHYFILLFITTDTKLFVIFGICVSLFFLLGFLSSATIKKKNFDDDLCHFHHVFTL